MLSTNFSLYSPVRTKVRSLMPVKTQMSSFHRFHTTDTVSLTFGAGNASTRGQLKKALNLKPDATEAEFQAARSKVLAGLLTFDSIGLFKETKTITKADLTSLMRVPVTSSREDLLKRFKESMRSQNRDTKQEDIDLICDLILAYPTPHPFEEAGRTLGE